MDSTMGNAGSVLLKICRVLLTAMVVSSTIVVFRYDMITFQIHISELNFENPNNGLASQAQSSDHSLAHANDGSIIDMTISDDGSETDGNQIPTNEHEAPEAMSSQSLSSKHSSSSDSDGTMNEGKSFLTAPYDESVTAVNQIPINEGATSAIGFLGQGSEVIPDGVFLGDTSKPGLAALREMTRFVLFLCDPSYFNGAVALVESLVDSLTPTSLPPLVMVVGDATIQPFEQQILEALGAQVTMVEQPQELTDAIAYRSQFVKRRWKGVFSKFLLFRPDIVECDIVFYIDVDAVARGDLFECMYDTLELFRSKPKLEILAVGGRDYFNNGIILARPRDTTFFYLVDMLQNGTCKGDCKAGDFKTKMRRKIKTDQDVFIEYTERFPDRYEAVYAPSPLNLRPMHQPQDLHQNCSVVHFAGAPKPWEAWFAIPNIGSPANGSALLSLPNGFPESLKALKKKRKKRKKAWQLPNWGLEVWRDHWNNAVSRLQAHPELAWSHA